MRKLFAAAFLVTGMCASFAAAQDASPAAPPQFPVLAPAAPVPTTDIAAPQPAADLLIQGDCFVAPPEWQADGIILSDQGKKLLISAGDSVYVNIGRDRVRPGMQCMVYRRKGKFKDPETNEVLGAEMMRIGKLEMTTDVGEKASTAKVILSYDALEIGDEVAIIAEDVGR